MPQRIREFLRWFLVLAFAVAGIAHLVSPGALMPIMPDWVPYQREVILVTGVCEIAGAIALATKRFRYVAGVMLAAYALCVWPANFKHAFGDVELGSTQLGWWYHATRLTLQPIIIWAALFAGRVIDWPFKKREG